jgi:LemA protein
MKFGKLFSAFVLVLSLSGCGINDIPTYEEQAKAAWAQVESQYQRRADLIPNLVATVEGFANQEEDVLTAVIEARASASSIQIDEDLLNNPAAFQAFEQAQGQLTSALSRLLVTVEAYPELTSQQNFLALQSQLEGTENRIAVARRDYIEAVRVYNTELRTLPGHWWAVLLYPDAEPLPVFSVDPTKMEVPEVSFGS